MTKEQNEKISERTFKNFIESDILHQLFQMRFSCIYFVFKKRIKLKTIIHFYLSLSPITPGRSFPSRSSRLAPPKYNTIFIYKLNKFSLTNLQLIHDSFDQ